MSREDDRKPVGYKNPPRHTRFQKGQSGNPSGRRKAAADLSVITLLEDALAERIPVTRKGRSRAMTKLGAYILQTVDNALKGDASARRDLFKFLELRERLRAASQPLEVDHGEHEEDLKERFRARERLLGQEGGDE